MSLFRYRPAPVKTGLCREGGFTLLELVAVMALLALLMGLVLPGLMRTAKKEGIRANLRQFATVLRLARSQAATSHRRVRVFLNKENGSYWLEGSNQKGVLAGMRLGDTRLVWEGVDRRQGYIAFYSDGTSSGGKLVMTDPAGRVYSLDVEIITGKVTLKIVEQT
ncbi:MAG: GspH/FimT family protein [Deltaproteobacteria bacterium]|nr:GspH/FimT family protein [Deltaproteobacteria bacterium]